MSEHRCWAYKEELAKRNLNEELVNLRKELGDDTILKIFKIMGTPKFTVWPLITEIKRELIIKDLKSTKENISFKEIAQKHGVAVMTVRRIKKKLSTLTQS